MFKFTSFVSYLFLMVVFPSMAFSASLTALDVKNMDKSTTVHLKLSESVDYSVFDIISSNTLILKLKGVDTNVVATNGNHKYVNSVGGDNIIKSVNFGYMKGDVKLSLKYKANYLYKILKANDGINIVFTSSKNKGESVSYINDIAVRDYSSYSEIYIKGYNIDQAKRKVFLLNNGSDLVLDIDTQKDVKSFERYPSTRVKSVVIKKLGKKVRLSFNLLNRLDKGYKISYGKDFIKIRVGSGKPLSYSEKEINISDVKFEAKKDHEYLDIMFKGKDPHVLFGNNKKNVVITVKNSTVASSKEGKFDVSEFFGIISNFNVHNDFKTNSVIIKANLFEKGKFSIIQLPNRIRVVVEPEAIAIARGSNAKSLDMFKYSGEKVELDYDNASIKNVLKTIASVSGVNFVISDKVNGTITIKLKDVPWDQALDLILRSEGLGKEKEGSIIRIAPMEDLKQEYKDRAETLKSSKELEPIVTEFIHLKYKKSIEVKAMFDSIVTSSSTANKATTASTSQSAAPEPSAENNSIVSSRGSVMFDNEKNMIIIRDTRSHVNNFKRIIAEIDTTPKQVLIEARIVEATDDFSREFGVSWGGTVNKVTANGQSALTLGAAGGVTSGNFTGGTFTRGKLVDLPAAVGLGSGGALGISIGKIAGNALDLELSAAEGDGKVKIVSKPRVLVLDGKEANINQGTDIPFQSTSQNQGTNVQFKKANLGLIVTPFVKGDNEIVMHVLVTKDSPGTALVGTNPIISTKQVETDIFVNNNKTVVIGGIYTTKDENVEKKVPLLGDIPVLGNLFKNKKSVKNRTELLVFITPKIMNDD